MDWLVNLFMGNGIASAVIILALTIAIGLLLNRIKFGSVSLGVTWVLFVGIVLSHFGLTIDPQICHFIKEFGLILFVYSIGIQVGPSFISSLRDGGIKLNMLAVLIIALGCITAYVIHIVSGEELTTMVGVLSGAVTNTPGLGAAQSVVESAQASKMATAYAVAYPLGVVGIIISMLIIRWIFRVKIDREAAKATRSDAPRTVRIDVRVTNHAIFGRTIEDIGRMTRSHFVVARIFDHENQQRIASGQTELQENDILRIVVSSQEVDLIQTLIGDVVKINDSEWGSASSQLEYRSHQTGTQRQAYRRFAYPRELPRNHHSCSTCRYRACCDLRVAFADGRRCGSGRSRQRPRPGFDHSRQLGKATRPSKSLPYIYRNLPRSIARLNSDCYPGCATGRKTRIGRRTSYRGNPFGQIWS